MKVAILKGESQFTTQIQRSILSYQIKGDLVDKINNRLLMEYDFLIVNSEQSPRVSNHVLEQIVLQKKVILVYIHHQSNLGSLYNILMDPYFLPLPKTNIIETLPSMLGVVHKWQKEVSSLKSDLTRTSKQLIEIKNTTKAKRILMDKGMSEEDAHNWIQKVAMDKRCKKSDVVNLIIEENIDIK